MWPYPRMPMVLPLISVPRCPSRSHCPALTEASASRSRFIRDRRRPTVCSPTASRLPSGLLKTRTPRCSAMATSMFSSPAPDRQMKRRAVSRSSKSASTLMRLRRTRPSASGCSRMPSVAWLSVASTHSIPASLSRRARMGWTVSRKRTFMNGALRQAVMSTPMPK